MITSAKSTLLASDEPSPVVELRAVGASPFFLACDHAGKRIPRALHDLGLHEPDLSRHIAWDIGIEGVARRLCELLDAQLIMQIYSRLVIDCNRPPGSPTSIAPLSDGTSISGNEKLSRDDAAPRIREIFAPYHGAIERALNKRQTAETPTILVSLHSFTPVYAGMPRPWHFGVLYNRYSTLAHALRDLMAAPGDLVVGDNEPYSVTDDTDYTIPVHGERRGLVHVAIEIRQDLITEETGQREWADRLAETLPKAAGL